MTPRRRAAMKSHVILTRITQQYARIHLFHPRLKQCVWSPGGKDLADPAMQHGEILPVTTQPAHPGASSAGTLGERVAQRGQDDMDGNEKLRRFLPAPPAPVGMTWRFVVVTLLRPGTLHTSCCMKTAYSCIRGLFVASCAPENPRKTACATIALQFVLYHVSSPCAARTRSGCK